MVEMKYPLCYAEHFSETVTAGMGCPVASFSSDIWGCVVLGISHAGSPSARNQIITPSTIGNPNVGGYTKA